jgi:hypothetical protein
MSRHRGWLTRGLSRIARGLDPDAFQDRQDTRTVLEFIQEWRSQHAVELEVEAKRLGGIRATLGALTRESANNRREVAKVRRLVTKHRERLSHLLKIAGVDQRGIETEGRTFDRLTRLARSPLPVVIGPWTGEVGFELLYWIPFLQWARQTFALDPDRLIVVSRGGTGAWYGHVTSQYEDIFRHVTPERFRAATEERKKQRHVRSFDRDLLRLVMRARGLRRIHVLHPTHMYRLFNPFWRYEATVKRLEEFARFRQLPPADEAPLLDRLPPLPAEFVAVRFYFSSCFPDTPDNRAFAARTLESLASRTHVVLLNNDIVVDDHRDFSPAATSRIHTIGAPMPAERNLAMQTAIIRRARAFVGTYGGYSYLAPFLGVSSLAFYSRTTFQRTHLELAGRVFQRLGPARLMPLDVAQAGALAGALAGDAGEFRVG